MTGSIKITLLAVTALVVLLILFVLGNQNKKGMSGLAVPEDQIREDQIQIPISGEEPGKETTKERLSEGFPDFPEYPGASLVNSYRKTEGANTGYEALWYTQGSPTEVMKYFISKLPVTGWIIDTPPDNNPQEVQLIAKKDNLKAYLTVSDSEEVDGRIEITLEIPYAL